MPSNDLELRVRPAELARLWQVSKQAVSQWIKKGIITPHPDGSISPKKAMKQYLANTDGTRMRANFMKTITNEVDDLKATNQGIADQLDQTRAALQTALAVLAEQAAWLQRFAELVDEQTDKLRATPDDDAWAAVMEDRFEQAGTHAMQVDVAEALSALDDSLASLWEPG